MQGNSKFQVKVYQWLLIMFCIGFMLRFYNLEITGLWMDEIHSVVGSDPDKTLGEVVEYSKRDQPPVFFLLLHKWFKIFGYNDFYGRLLSLIIGSLGIISMYFLGKELKNPQTGLMASFFTMINYFHIDYSRQVRFYTLVFLLSSLSYLFFIRCFTRKRSIDFVLYTIVTAALLNTHYFGLVLFASQAITFVIIILWKKITDKKFILYSVLSGVAVVLSFVHWLPTVMSDLQIPVFHAQKLSWDFAMMFFWIYFRDVATCIFCAVLIVLGVRAMYLEMKLRSFRLEDAILLTWLGFGFLIPILYSILRMPILEYKYTFIVIPAILILVAMGVDVINHKKIKAYMICILFFTFINNALFTRSIYFVRHPQEQWREAAKEIVKTNNPDQVVFSQYAWYYRYYFKIYKSINQPLEPAYADFKAWIDRSNTVWVMTSTRFPDAGLSSNQKSTLELNFKLENETKLNDAIVQRYVRR